METDGATSVPKDRTEDDFCTMVPKDYRRISVRGLTIADNDNNDHSIRVFAQVEGLEKQAIATQGDASTGFRSRQDACEGGCIAACERAAVGACAPNALESYTMTTVELLVQSYTMTTVELPVQSYTMTTVELP
eukprot:gene15881-18834_t